MRRRGAAAGQGETGGGDDDHAVAGTLAIGGVPPHPRCEGAIRFRGHRRRPTPQYMPIPYPATALQFPAKFSAPRSDSAKIV